MNDTISEAQLLQDSAAVAGLAVKGAPAAKTLLGTGLIGVILGPILALFGGILGTWAGIRNTQPPRERRFMIRMSILLWLLLAGLMGVLILALVGMIPRWAFWASFAAFFALLPPLIMLTNVRQRQIQIEDGTYPPPPGSPQRANAAHTCASFVDSVFGSTAWLLLMAGIAHDWAVFAIILAAAMLTFLVAAHVACRHGRRGVGAGLALVGVAALTFTVVNLRWDAWLPLYRQSRYYDPASDVSLEVLSVIMSAAFVGTALVLWVAFRRCRSDEPSS
jgi:Ca2+/Na+ antiporter